MTLPIGTTEIGPRYLPDLRHQAYLPYQPDERRDDNDLLHDGLQSGSVK